MRASTSDNPAAAADSGLARRLTRRDLTAIVINTIIGAGIFGLPSKVYAQIGSYSLIAFLVCAGIVALILLCYAEVSSRFSAAGGPYLFAREAFGDAVGFEVGWLYWIVRVTTFAANCNLLLTYLGFFVPDANSGALRIIFILIVVGSITVVNFVGVRESALMTNVVTIGKLVPLAVFVLVGSFFIEPGNFTFAEVPGYSSFSSAVLLLIYAFVGFEAATALSGETKEPARTMPFGLIAGLIVVAVFYVAIQVVAIGTLPGLGSSERPIADAASAFLGPVGASLITIGALVSILGNLNVGILSSTRMLFAMSEHGSLPRAVGRTHRSFRTPHVAIFVTGVVVLILTIQSSFLSAVAIATITRLLVYATTCLAVPVFRRRLGSAPFQVPLGIAAAVLSLVLIVWLLTNVDIQKEGIPIAVAAAAGLVLFFIFRAVRSADGSDRSEEEAPSAE